MSDTDTPTLPDPLFADNGTVADLLREGRDQILRDWMSRVRNNQAVRSGQALSDPLLLNHMPQLFDTVLDRLSVHRPRDEAEQFAAVHGFTRRVSGYDVVETVVELTMFRRAIWSYLSAVEAPIAEAYITMERVDGMIDRACITSLQAFLDPAARMLARVGEAVDQTPPID